MTVNPVIRVKILSTQMLDANLVSRLHYTSFLSGLFDRNHPNRSVCPTILDNHPAVLPHLGQHGGPLLRANSPTFSRFSPRLSAITALAGWWAQESSLRGHLGDQSEEADASPA